MPRYTNAQIEAALRETHGMLWIAAKRLGCSPNTLKARVTQSAGIRDIIEHERGLMGDTAELKLYQAIQNGEQWGIQFYLRTQGKDRGYVERQEISGPNAGPVQTEDVSLSDDDRAARILALVQRAGERATRSLAPGEPDLDAAEGAAD